MQKENLFSPFALCLFTKVSREGSADGPLMLWLWQSSLAQPHSDPQQSLPSTVRAVPAAAETH